MGNYTKCNGLNNIIYVEPNYNNSLEQYDQHGLDTIEMIPSTEDLSIYINIEVEVKGRTVQSESSSNGGSEVIVMSITSANGKTKVNFMQGSKIKSGDGYINSLTTDYTDIFLGDLKTDEPTTELFGIKSVDVSYNTWYVPEVTIEFVDIRGASLFTRREMQEAAKGADGAVTQESQNIADSFFQCFFTFPYPKFTMLLKGFYGQPVEYELTCSDFRARFDSSTGNFGCTAKFVGYAFSFLNDIMLNALVAAPYSDYIGAEYWDSQKYKISSIDGGESDAPKLAYLMKIIKNATSYAEKIAQSDPSIEEKNAVEEKQITLSSILGKYRTYVSIIDNAIKDKKNISGNNYYFSINGENGDTKTFILLTNENSKDFSSFVNDENGAIHGAWEGLSEDIKQYNETHSNELLPELPDFSSSRPREIIKSENNYETQVGTVEFEANRDFKREELYNLFCNEMTNANNSGKGRLYLNNRYAYDFKSNGFLTSLEIYIASNSKKEVEVQEKIEAIEKSALAEALGFKPTIKNITKILMAHFDTFVHMVFKCSQTISAEKRTIESLQTSSESLPDIKNRDNDSSSVVVPPFPKFVKKINRNGVTNNEEAWVGDANGNWLEKDLVHGLLNGINAAAQDIGEAGKDASNGSTNPVSSVVPYPLTPIDFVASEKPYNPSGYDKGEVSSLLGLVALRAISILTMNNLSKSASFQSHSEILGKAEALNFLSNNKLPQDLYDKLMPLVNDANKVMDILYGTEASYKPNGGKGPWPWRKNPNGGGILAHMTHDNSGAALNYSKLDICSVQNGGNAIPFENLSWSSILSDIIPSKGARAILSEKYLTTKSYPNVVKNNNFVIDTNVKRFFTIAERQLVGLDGIEEIASIFKDASGFNGDVYKGFLNNNFAEEYIIPSIENAINITPSKDSCVLPKTSASVGWNSLRKTSFSDFVNLENEWENVKIGGETIKRKATGTFEEYLKELNHNDTTIACYSSFQGNSASLFTSEYYYYLADKSNNNPYIKAIMFLVSLSWIIDYKKCTDHILSAENTFSIVPLPSVMLLGAAQWANDNSGTTGVDSLAVKSLSKYYYDTEKFDNLRDDVKKKLKSIFVNWVDKGVENDSLIKPFKTILNGLELTFKKGNHADAFKKISDASEDELLQVLRDELGDSFFENYIGVGERHTNGFVAFNRDGTASQLAASYFALAGCIFAKTNAFFQNFSTKDKKNIYTFIVNSGNLKNFFSGFLQVIQESGGTPSLSEETTSTQVAMAKETETTTDIKIAIYRYCKLLYDKWLAGMTESELAKMWSMDSFFENSDKYFHFIDCYYNDIGDDIMIDLGHFLECIEGSYTKDEYSLLSALSSICQKNRFMMHCVQNFMDLSDKANMERMFDPVPWTDTWDVKKHPDFVFMYSYEPSSHLDLESGQYDNDSFLINDSNQTNWPEALTSRNVGATNGYQIPAFGVSYGKMYQSYFKDIQVGMDNPMVTEQSIKAQFQIAFQGNESGNTGDRSNVAYYGQDLYSIYSNNSYTCNVTMMGCAWVQPLMYFSLNNVQLFRGTYLIEKVNHHIEPGNMTTRFTGVRMANTSTRIVQDFGVRGKNDGNGNGGDSGDGLTNENRLAGVDNDCPYKTYPLTMLGGDFGETNYSSYFSKTVGNTKGNKLKEPWANRNLLDSLTAALCAESDGTEIGTKMVAATMYNRVRFENGDFKYLLNPGQYSVWNNGKADSKFKNHPNNWNNIKAWLTEVFTKGAAGTLAGLSYTTPNWDLNKNGNNVKNLKPNTKYQITAEDASQFYCYGFKNEWDGTHSKTDNYIRHKDCPLLCVLGTTTPQAVCAVHNYTKFKIKERVNKTNEKEGQNKISDIAYGYLHAINQTTASSTIKVNVGIIKEKSNGNEIYLNNPSNNSKFAELLDVIINAYGSSTEYVYWVRGADEKATPEGYIVKVKEGSTATKIYMSTSGSPKTSIEVDCENVHNSFKLALRKKYKTADNKNLASDTSNRLQNPEKLFEPASALTECNALLQSKGLIAGGNVVGKWPESVRAMANWYQQNVHTYLGKTGKGGGTRKKYSCSLINGDVMDDCSSFVSACLTLFGASGFSGYPPSSHAFNGDKKTESQMQAAGFTKIAYSKENLRPYDIIVRNGHTEIYAGKIGGRDMSYSWGSVHDVDKGGMPSSTAKQEYKYIWRQS